MTLKFPKLFIPLYGICGESLTQDEASRAADYFALRKLLNKRRSFTRIITKYNLLVSSNYIINAIEFDRLSIERLSCTNDT